MVQEAEDRVKQSPLTPCTSVCAWKRVRSLARIKVSAFGAGDRGFKSHRTRIILFGFILRFFEQRIIEPHFAGCYNGHDNCDEEE